MLNCKVKLVIPRAPHSAYLIKFCPMLTGRLSCTDPYKCTDFYGMRRWLEIVSGYANQWLGTLVLYSRHQAKHRDWPAEVRGFVEFAANSDSKYRAGNRCHGRQQMSSGFHLATEHCCEDWRTPAGNPGHRPGRPWTRDPFWASVARPIGLKTATRSTVEKFRREEGLHPAPSVPMLWLATNPLELYWVVLKSRRWT